MFGPDLLAAIDEHNDRVEESLRESDPATPRDTSPDRWVLVVDDDVDLCEIAADVLKAHGWGVRCAHNGVEAIRTLYYEIQTREYMRRPSPKPALILVDLHMPISDGWELLGQLKINPAYHDIRLAIISGTTTIEEWATPFLRKPFTSEELAAFVAKHAEP